MSKWTPYQRIMRAAKRGTGVRLSADEVFALSADDAISTCAANDDAEQKEIESLAKAGAK